MKGKGKGLCDEEMEKNIGLRLRKGRIETCLMIVSARGVGEGEGKERKGSVEVNNIRRG